MLLFYINFGDRNPPYPALGSNIPSARRRGQRFHFLQCRGSLPRLRFVNRHGGTLRRSGWVAFTKTYSREKWLILHLPPTFVIIIHIPRPLHPGFWHPRIPVSHIPTSHSWCPQVPRLASPSPKSQHTRPDVPVPLSPSTFIHSPTAQKLFQSLYLSTLLIHTYYFVTSFLMRKNCHDKWNVYFKLADWHEIRKPFA